MRNISLLKKYFKRGMSISLTSSIMLSMMGFSVKAKEDNEVLEDYLVRRVEVVEPLFDKIKAEVKDEYKNLLPVEFPEMNELLEEVELTNEEKLTIILAMYGITETQFNEIVATVIGEAAADSYEDAYAVINTLYNRLRSMKWHYSIDKYRYEGAGYNIYYQLIQTGQFEIYYTGAYKLYLNEDIYYTPGYQACIDMLFSQEIMHNYLSFTSKNGKREGKEQFVTDGNLYYSSLKEADTIDLTGVYTYEVEEKSVSRKLQR